MRDELSTLLGDLAGKPSAPGLLDVATDTPAIERPALKDRAAMWDLAIKLGRELGTSIDTRPPNAAAVEAAEAPARRRGRVDYGP